MDLKEFIKLLADVKKGEVKGMGGGGMFGFGKKPPVVVRKKQLVVDVLVSGLADKAAADAMVATLKTNKGDGVLEPEVSAA